MIDLSRGRIASLDGLRAVAIIMVLLEHGRASFAAPDPVSLRWVTSQGLLGVEVFFSISGFLITLLMLREWDRTGTLNLRQFYLRRVLRIVPAYAALLLAVAFLMKAGVTARSPRDWAAALTFTFNFRRQPLTWELGHLWSLSIEEQFYLIWPVLFLWSPPRWRVLIPVAAMVLALAWRCLFVWVFQEYNYAVRAWTICRIDSIAAGCLLAILAWDPPRNVTLRRWASARGSGVAAFAVLCASVVLARTVPTWDCTVSYSCNAMAITWLMWSLIVKSRSPAGRILNRRPMIWIGAVSYSLYLWQQLFLKDANHVWTTFPQNLLFTSVAAMVSFWWIERPFLVRRNRMTAKVLAGTPSSDEHLRYFE